MLRLAIVSLTLASFACSPSKKPNIVAVTEVGAPMGAPVTVAIGPTGGSINSSDGKLTLTVPANAVSAMTSLTVTPIESKSPGGVRSYRLGPEGTTFTTKAKISFKYSAADVAGSKPSLLSVAFQDGKRRWKRLPTTVDENAKTVEVETTHLSDWSMVRGAQIRPPEANVQVKKSVRFSVQQCEYDATSKDEDLHGLSFACNEYDDVSPIVDATLVEGIRGGSASVGRVTPGVQFSYIAPDHEPSPNPVTVSAEMHAMDDGKTSKTILVAMVNVFGEDKRPVDNLPKSYTGTGTISVTSGAPGNRLNWSGSFQVSGGRAEGGSIGDYTLQGTFSVSGGVMDLPDCNCTITGGSAATELGLGVNAELKQQAVALSASVPVVISCTPTAPRTCPSMSNISVTWQNVAVPSCTGSSTTTFTEPISLSGGYQQTCGSDSRTVSWMLSGSY